MIQYSEAADLGVLSLADKKMIMRNKRGTTGQHVFLI